MKKIALLGSTGSIGRSTLKVVRHLKEELKVVALAARSNLDLLEAQVREFQPLLVAISDPVKAAEFRKRMPQVDVVEGPEGLILAAAHPDADFTMLAMSGIAGLEPALAAIAAGKQIGLANKEILVSAGELVAKRAEEKGIKLLPVDSEHSALFQCLEGNSASELRRMILTASGGPFRALTLKQLQTVSIEEALAHPNWRMGPKVTIDSSTLMNKGLELIEARWLFGVAPERIEVIVHPQSIIHSCVEYCDGSMLAQMSEPDMVLPIQYALTWPNRRPGLMPPFDFLKNGQLTFESPDRKKFTCLKLAEESLKMGRSYSCALNAANEILVDRFLNGELNWIDIGTKLEKLMSSHSATDVLTLETVLAVDRENRMKAKEL